MFGMDFTDLRTLFIFVTCLIHFYACDEEKTKKTTTFVIEESVRSIWSLNETNTIPSVVNFLFDEDVHSHCKPKIMKFANTSSEFIRCSIMNARPVRMCQSCIKKYWEARHAYDDITADDHGEDACKLYLLNADRIQIIKYTQDDMLTLWTNSNCDGCFKDPSENMTLNDETVKIQQYVNETVECIITHNNTKCTVDPKNESHCYHEACKNCSDIYQHLNDEYEKLVLKYGMLNLCMDIVDQVNNTRKVWSKELSCVNFENDVVVLFTIVAFFCICPPVFYFGSWIQSDEQKSKIIPQKRLATSRSAVQVSIN